MGILYGSSMPAFIMLVVVLGGLAAAATGRSIATTRRPLPILFWFIFLLSLAIRSMSVGIAYAIWAGLGIVLITAIGVFHFGERLDAPAILGLGLIVAGVIVINLFSKTVLH